MKPLKKTVTSVTLDPEIFQMGREEGYNFSQLLQKAIVERSDPKREIIYIEGIIARLEAELSGYREQLIVLKSKAELKERTLFDELVEQNREYYEQHGMVDFKLIERFSVKLDRPVNQLEEDVIYELSR